MGFFGRALFNFLHGAVGSATVLLYPLYESKRAMENPASRADHQEWLTYWVLLSFLTSFELYLSSIISWIPLWPYIKLVACLWLVMPSFKGAAYVHENIAMKFMKIESVEKIVEEEKESEKKDEVNNKNNNNNEEEDEVEEIEEEVDEQTKIFRAWMLVDEYIEKNGAESLEKIVKSGLQVTEANKQKKI